VGGTDHATPYTYDTHVPLAFYGLPFQAGTYRTHAEPVDLAPTFASLLGINAPTHSVGRVLTEMLAPQRRGASSSLGGQERSSPTVEGQNFKPASDDVVPIGPPSTQKTAAVTTTELQVGAAR
jgi:arylsulfatase A-like enzyme